MPDPFERVIFDCDGVLVDSERPAGRIEAEVITALGWALSESDIVDRFVGRSDSYMHVQVFDEMDALPGLLDDPR
jgi:beta-phosphoglucomutase-like phosphatase (HAD superfamily)